LDWADIQDPPPGQHDLGPWSSFRPGVAGAAAGQPAADTPAILGQTIRREGGEDILWPPRWCLVGPHEGDDQPHAWPGMNRGNLVDPVGVGNPGQPMYHWASTPPGYKIWVGDLPQDTLARQVNDRIWQVLYQGQQGTQQQKWRATELIFEDIRDIVVKKAAAATGASYCVITVGQKRAACAIYSAIYYGWEADTQIAGQERRKNAMHWLPVSSQAIHEKGKGIGKGKGSAPWAAGGKGKQTRLHWEDTRQGSEPVRFQHPGSPLQEPGHPHAARGPPRPHHSLLGQPAGQPGQPGGEPGAAAGTTAASSGIPADAFGAAQF